MHFLSWRGLAYSCSALAIFQENAAPLSLSSEDILKGAFDSIISDERLTPQCLEVPVAKVLDSEFDGAEFGLESFVAILPGLFRFWLAFKFPSDMGMDQVEVFVKQSEDFLDVEHLSVDVEHLSVDVEHFVNCSDSDVKKNIESLVAEKINKRPLPKARSQLAQGFSVYLKGRFEKIYEGNAECKWVLLNLVKSICADAKPCYANTLMFSLLLVGYIDSVVARGKALNYSEQKEGCESAYVGIMEKALLSFTNILAKANEYLQRTHNYVLDTRLRSIGRDSLFLDASPLLNFYQALMISEPLPPQCSLVWTGSLWEEDKRNVRLESTYLHWVLDKASEDVKDKMLCEKPVFPLGWIKRQTNQERFYDCMRDNLCKKHEGDGRILLAHLIYDFPCFYLIRSEKKEKLPSIEGEEKTAFKGFLDFVNGNSNAEMNVNDQEEWDDFFLEQLPLFFEQSNGQGIISFTMALEKFARLTPPECESVYSGYGERKNARDCMHKLKWCLKKRCLYYCYALCEKIINIALSIPDFSTFLGELKKVPFLVREYK